MTLSPEGEIHSIYKKRGKIEKNVKFKTNNLTLDPFSLVFFARSLDWEKGATRVFDTYNGNNRYLITFTAVDKVKMDVNGQKKDVWVISPKVKKLVVKNPKKKLREAKIYITADESRDLLLIESEVFVGSLKTKLVSYTPPKSISSDTTLARGQTEIKYNF